MRQKICGILALAVLGLLVFTPVEGARIQLQIKQAEWELKPGLVTKVWTYGGTVPGTPIVVEQGELIEVEGFNGLPATTNIHWHGLVVPNDQDGPGKVLEPGKPFSYSFKASETGTYWYHSHFRPVLEQVDMGLYAPLIVKAPEDALYSGDHVFVLDDWYLDSRGIRKAGTARGDMERYGNVETVNGKTGVAIPPLTLKEGELHKLRFINASTAAVHALKVSGHRFRVTHTDGHALPEPYFTDSITLQPGERLDVELAAAGKVGESYSIESERGLGMTIPVVYSEGKVTPVISPFVPPAPKKIDDIESKAPDFILELNSTSNMTQASSGHGGHGGHGTSSAPGPVQWTINGKIFPDTDPLKVALGKYVKVRLWNKDTAPGHSMDHPIHIHGTAFLVVSVNGKLPEREMWKDTVNVPAGEYVDVAFAVSYPGEWMLHCHILDHEDGGMMTRLIAK